MADLQDGIGEGVSGRVYTEGSLPHTLLQGAWGCAPAAALDGNCASGAAAGIAQSTFAGLQEGAPKHQPGQSDGEYAAACPDAECRVRWLVRPRHRVRG